MRLPRWPDTGHWNDAVVTLMILAALAGGGYWAWCWESPLLMLGVVLLAPVIGFVLGFCLVVLLSTIFAERVSLHDPAASTPVEETGKQG
jgi:hypothetical protein